LSVFEELKRRNVFRVSFAYIVLAWLVMQIGDTLGPALLPPNWIISALAYFLILGFPMIAGNKKMKRKEVTKTR